MCAKNCGLMGKGNQDIKARPLRQAFLFPPATARVVRSATRETLCDLLHARPDEFVYCDFAVPVLVHLFEGGLGEKLLKNENTERDVKSEWTVKGMWEHTSAEWERWTHLGFFGGVAVLLEEVEEVLDDLLQLLLRDRAVAVDVENPEDLPQVLLGRAVRHHVQDDHELSVAKAPRYSRLDVKPAPKFGLLT